MKLRLKQTLLNLMKYYMVARTDLTSIDLSTLSAIIRTKMNKNYKPIDYSICTSKLAHENQHEYDFRNEVWGGEPYNFIEDQDGNFLRDSWEIENLGINGVLFRCINDPPEKRFTDCYREWAEQNAKVVERNYPDNSFTNDWAFPGSNYK